jgi:hypothetical protein
LAGNAFTYQGYLTDGGSPADGPYDFVFSLYADPAGTQWVANAAAVNDHPVVDGLFTVEVDVTDGMWGDVYFYLNGDARWLQIGVRPGASTGAYTYLSPLQPLTPAPYALALPGMNTVQNGTSANVLGGYSWNYADPNVVGATVGGGGHNGGRNEVYGDYATVGGGRSNDARQGDDTVGGGASNTADGGDATVGGGEGNTAGAACAVVAGGCGNVANNTLATVAGGDVNYATAQRATIGGGSGNSAGGQYATVPGGRTNYAGGDYSFAAGRRAKAYNLGSFVWADATDADFASTADNQFRVRANGGADVVGSLSGPLLTVTNSGGDGISVPDGVDGIQVGDAGNYPLYGLYIPSPGTTFTALWVNTAVSNGEWGLYTPDNVSAGNVMLQGLRLLAVADGSQPLEAGMLVAVSGLAEPLPQGNEALIRVRAADSQKWTGVVGVVAGRMALQTAPDKEEQQLGSADGPARPGEYVAITVMGLAHVRAEPEAGLAAGQRLTASAQPGRVRALQTRTVEGLVVAEGAAVVGIALGPVDEATGLVPVMVTLR